MLSTVPFDFSRSRTNVERGIYVQNINSQNQLKQQQFLPSSQEPEEVLPVPPSPVSPRLHRAYASWSTCSGCPSTALQQAVQPSASHPISASLPWSNTSTCSAPNSSQVENLRIYDESPVWLRGQQSAPSLHSVFQLNVADSHHHHQEITPSKYLISVVIKQWDCERPEHLVSSKSCILEHAMKPSG